MPKSSRDSKENQEEKKNTTEQITLSIVPKKEEQEREWRRKGQFYLSKLQSLLREFEALRELKHQLIDKKFELISDYGETYFIQEQEIFMQKTAAVLDSAELKIMDVAEQIGEMFEELNKFMGEKK